MQVTPADPTSRPNKHRMRTEATRKALFDSAQKIFIRDGYERAQIDEIAAGAGRTRGAVYAQFSTKEDLFLSLLRERSQATFARSRRLLARERLDTPEQLLAAFRKVYAELHDPEWAILMLELKLFAIRHRESMGHLKELFQPFSAASQDFLRALKRPGAPGRAPLEASVWALHTIVSAIVLDMRFEPEIMNLKNARRILGEVFDGLFPPPAPNGRPAQKGIK